MNLPVILLTTTVNVQKKDFIFQTDKKERLNTYIKSIRQWLVKTNFHIVIVENSGYLFDELTNEFPRYKDRFEIITFDENIDAPHLVNHGSKGDSELFSINYAFDKSQILKSANFIIKITGRYFIPNFEAYILNLNLGDFDCLRQNDQRRCEIVGSHIKNFHTIFYKDPIDKHGKYNGHVETIYMERISQFGKIFACKVLDIEPTQRGGLSQIYRQL